MSTPPRLPEAVLLDMDGTLFDSEKLWTVSLDELAESLGGSLSPALRSELVGSNLTESVELVHQGLGVHADPQRSGEFLLRRTKELFGQGLAWKSGAMDLIAGVHRAAVPLALVTSTHRDLTDVALRNFPPGTFDFTICGDEVTRTKPDPESYLRAARALGADPARCVAVEDSPRGIASAEAAGAAVLAVPSEMPIPPGPRRVVTESLAGWTVADLAEVLERLSG